MKLDIPPFKVDSADFKTPMLITNNGSMILDMVSISNLDQVIFEEEGILTLSIQFPFKLPHGTALQASGKFITIRDVINTTRNAYRSLYRRLTSFPCDIEKCGVSSELYELTYPINSLHVEGVYFCHSKKIVKIHTHGNPIVRKDPNIPF